jgi:hypothetical protein
MRQLFVALRSNSGQVPRSYRNVAFCTLATLSPPVPRIRRWKIPKIKLLSSESGQEPKLGLLYEPGQVAAALEVKKMGSFGEKTLETIRANFTKLRDLKVCCAYVTVEERDSYRHKATEENLGGFPCFTLAWHKVSDGPLQDKQDWDRFLAFLRGCIA